MVTTVARNTLFISCATRATTSLYTGIRRSPEQIVAMAIENNVDAIGVSLLSGRTTSCSSE